MKKGYRVRRIDDNFKQVETGKTYTVANVYPGEDPNGNTMVSLEGVEGFYLARKFEVVSNGRALPEWF